MAHDFSIKAVGLEDKQAYFFGYCEAAMYIAFKCMEFNAGVSGSFDGKELTKEEAKQGLEKAFELTKDYPDPTRADDLKDFYKNVLLQSSEDQMFYVHYS